MSFAAARPAGVDLLTRTTLQIDANLPAASLAGLIAALQRVPGVLLAEVNAAGDGATVAHDAAVPAASLLAAVAGSGARAVVVGDTRPAPPAKAAVAAKPVSSWHMFAVAAGAFAALTIVESLFPRAVAKPWVLPAFIAALWMGFLARAIVVRRSLR